MDRGAWNDADALTRSALELFRQRRYADALDELDQAIAIDPYNAQVHFHRGVMLDELERYEDAIEAYRQSIAIGGDEVETMNRLAIDLHQINRSNESVRMFERIELLDPTYEPSYCNRIHVLVQLGRHEQAEEVFYLGRLQHEHCPRCYFNMGVSLQVRGHMKRAAGCYERALDLTDAGSEVHRRLGDVLMAMGESERARQHYLKALSIDSSDIAALVALIDLQISAKRWAEAEKRLRAALRLAPDHAGVQLHWGRLMHERCDDGAAAMALRRAIQLDPTILRAHLTLARIAVRAGQTDTAVHHLRAELLLGPHSPSSLLELGGLLLDIGAWGQAVGCYQRLLEMDPKHAVGWQNLGLAQAQQGHLMNAIEAFGQATAIDPTRASAWHNLALAQAELRDWPAASATLAAGLRHNPQDSTLLNLRLRLRLRRIRQAICGKHPAKDSHLTKDSHTAKDSTPRSHNNPVDHRQPDPKS